MTPKPNKPLRAVVDTSLGVEFVDLLRTGHGLLVDERIKEKCAEALNLPVNEVFEIICVTEGPA